MPTVKIKSLVPYILEPEDYLFLTSHLNQPLHVMGLNWNYDEGKVNIITVYRDDDPDDLRCITLFPEANQLVYELEVPSNGQ